MSAFNQKRNTDDVFFRTVMIGVLNLLNHSIVLKVTSNETDVPTDYKIPFYFSQGGDERYMQDFYTSWFECVPTTADGNYDKVPIGLVSLQDIGINAANLDSRFSHGERTKEEDGEIKQYYSNIMLVPIALTFNVVIKIDTWLHALIVAQKVIEAFWKAQAFGVQYDGGRAECQIGFPDSMDAITSKLINYSYPGIQEPLSLTFILELETYMPIYDSTTEQFAGDRIEFFGLNVDLTNSTTPPGNSGTQGDVPIDQDTGP